MKEEEKKEVYKTILDNVQPPKKGENKKYNVKDYYGTGFYKQKKDNKYCFYLIYDYSSSRNQLKSSTLVIESIDELLLAIEVMEEYSVNKAEKSVAKFSLKDKISKKSKANDEIERPNVFG